MESRNRGTVKGNGGTFALRLRSGFTSGDAFVGHSLAGEFSWRSPDVAPKDTGPPVQKCPSRDKMSESD